MKSMLVLCALLGLSAATAGPALLDAGHGLGWGVAPVAIGHGGASAYSTQISHGAAIHGGPVVLSAPLVRSYSHAAPLAINHGVRVAHAPAVLGVSHGIAGPAVLSHGYAAPAVLSHGSVVRSYSAPIAIGHGGLALGKGLW